jgi:Co/Zn/Cd efflux system component
VVIRFFDGVIELMDSCCVNKACALEQLRERQERPSESFSSTTLRLFAIALIAGLIAGSAALLADSLDGLGDALVYGFSLYVMGRAVLWKVRAALRGHGFVRRFRAGQLVYKLLFPQIPAYETMGAVGALALLVNATCCAALWRHRGEDINMRSVVGKSDAPLVS